MPRSSSTTSLASALNAALGEFGMERKIKEQEIFVRWEECVGSAIANHARPERFRNGVLILHVEEATWRHELRFRVEELRDRINAALGISLVQSITLH